MRKKTNRLGPETSRFPKPKVHLVKSWARTEIPFLVRELGADLVVVGTGARTGIGGLLVGNTVEMLLTQIDCLALTLKPEGFLSPVTPESQGRGRRPREIPGQRRRFCGRDSRIGPFIPRGCPEGDRRRPRTFGARQPGMPPATSDAPVQAARIAAKAAPASGSGPSLRPRGAGQRVIGAACGLFATTRPCGEETRGPATPGNVPVMIPGGSGRTSAPNRWKRWSGGVGGSRRHTPQPDSHEAGAAQRSRRSGRHRRRRGWSAGRRSPRSFASRTLGFSPPGAGVPGLTPHPPGHPAARDPESHPSDGDRDRKQGTAAGRGWRHDDLGRQKRRPTAGTGPARWTSPAAIDSTPCERGIVLIAVWFAGSVEVGEQEACRPCGCPSSRNGPVSTSLSARESARDPRDSPPVGQAQRSPKSI